MAFRKYNKAPVVKEPRVMRSWSSYQEDVFRDIREGKGNTQIDAFAGSGKTSTLVEGFYHVPSGNKTLMVAFAKPIQVELERRAPAGVTTLTLHSLGYRAIRKVFPKIILDDKGDKLYGYVKAERGDDPDTEEVRANMGKAVSLCKSYLISSPEDVDVMMDRHDIDPGTDSRQDFIASTLKVLAACRKDTARLDFDDMIDMVNVHNIPLEKYDYVFGDEIQDLTGAQINMMLNCVKDTGRAITVGDERQAIFAFRGADSNAINNVVERCSSKRLPLSVTYRCAKSIVQLAQTLVPGIQYAPNAEEGLVDQIPDSKIEGMVKPGDFILSRTNAPLIRWCLNLLKAGIPSNIQGRDLGKNLWSLVRKSKAKKVDEFLVWLDEYQDIEFKRLTALKRDTSIVRDKCECLINLCEGAKDLKAVKDNLDRLFHDTDDHGKVILSTIHKAKGLERDRVFMLSKTFRTGKNIEEDNISYVAITRAKKELYIVN